MGEVIILPVVRIERDSAQTDGGKARMNRRRRRLFGDASLEVREPILPDTAPCEYVAPAWDPA